MPIEGTSITTNRERAKWWIIGSSLTALLGIEVYFLVHDISFLGSGSAMKITTPPIADLVSSRNTVRVQAPGDIVWEDTRDGQTLYRRQTLMTLEDSRAEIAFLDGTGLMMEEGSMIQLEKSPSNDGNDYNRILVQLVRGKLQKLKARGEGKLGPESPELWVAVGNSHAILSPDSELSITAGPESAGGNTISVIKGEIRVQSPAGVAQVQAGDRITVQDRGSQEAPTTKKTPFSLLSPRKGHVIVISDAAPIKVQFEWLNLPLAQAAESAYELQVSTDSSFKGDFLSTRIGFTQPPLREVKTRLELPSPRASTRWYWRVRTLNNKAISEVESFELKPLLGPDLIAPLSGAKAKQAPLTHFAWEGVEDGASYEFELKGGASARTLETAQTHLSIENIAAGTYTWRVRAKRKDRNLTPWSDARGLQVLPADAIERAPPPPPELLDPEVEKRPARKPKKRSWIDFLFPSAWADEAVVAEINVYRVHLRWKKVPGVSKYRVQVAKDKKFSEILGEAEATQPRWSWPYPLGLKLPQGKAYYRVASVDREGRAGGYSQAKPIVIPQEVLAREPVRFDPISQAAVPVAQPAAPAPTSRAESSAPQVSVSSAPPLPVARNENRWNISGELHTGYGSAQQSSSDPALSSVSLRSPFLQQKIRLHADLIRLTEIERSSQIRHWSGTLEIAALKFIDSGLPRKTVQPETSAVPVKLRALRWSAVPRNWQWAWGALAELDYSWAKDGAQSVTTQSGFSLGPAAGLIAGDGRGAVSWVPAQWGAVLELPLTGILMGAQLGPQGTAWSEWSVARFRTNWVGMKIEAEGAYQRWGAPQGTSFVSWSLWAAPTFHFGSSGIY